MDEALAIQWMNLAAGKLLENRDHLSVQNGVLTAADAGHAGLIRHLVANCREGKESVSLSFEDIHIIIRAHPIRTDGRQGFAGLRIHLSGEDFPHRYSNLETAFDLTRSEMMLMRHLAKGLNAELVAAEMSISVETVRSHIRNIYRKVGAGCRESLFYRLRPFLDM